jgi:ABC-2 type transport system ATP-binding protein
MDAIITEKLTKKFKSLTAVNEINLNIKQGELFGLLGPNGAGKTTFISMLSTMLSSTSGKAEVNGFDIQNQKDEVRNSIGIVFQDPSLDSKLTARENLDLHGMLYGMDAKKRKERIDFVLKIVDLEEKQNIQVQNFSGGMKRRLEIGRGLMHKPKILFLDEPTLGLDPQTRRHIWDYIKKLNKTEKTTIILTTHYLEEADFLCDQVGIIDEGKIVALDTPKKLKKKIHGELIYLKSKNNKKLAGKLSKLNANSIEEVDGLLKINVENPEKIVSKIVMEAEKSKIEIISIEFHKPSLEDVFIHYTGKNIREEMWNKKDFMRDYMRRARHGN